MYNNKKDDSVRVCAYLEFGEETFVQSATRTASDVNVCLKYRNWKTDFKLDFFIFICNF